MDVDRASLRYRGAVAAPFEDPTTTFPVAVLALAAVLLVVGGRAVATRSIRRGRAVHGHITGRRAVAWGWAFVAVGAAAAAWAVAMLF